jgi:ribosomal protein L4
MRLANAELDAVVVCSPNLYHAPQTIDAFKAGKHVLVVSPVVGTALVKSAANIPHLSVLRADSLNVVDLVNADTIIVEQAALAEIQEVYG